MQLGTRSLHILFLCVFSSVITTDAVSIIQHITSQQQNFTFSPTVPTDFITYLINTMGISSFTSVPYMRKNQPFSQNASQMSSARDEKKKNSLSVAKLAQPTSFL